MSWLDAQSKQDESADASASGATSSSLGGDTSKDLIKVHSREDSSMTSLTVDDVESDKSSTTFSSASSSISTASLPGNLKKTTFHLDAITTPRNQDQGQQHPENESEEHFIFEMDM